MTTQTALIPSNLVDFHTIRSWVSDQERTNTLSAIETTIVALFKSAVTGNSNENLAEYTFAKIVCRTRKAEVSPLSGYTFDKESRFISEHMIKPGFSLLLSTEVVTERNQRIREIFHSCMSTIALDEVGEDLPGTLLRIFYS